MAEHQPPLPTAARRRTASNLANVIIDCWQKEHSEYDDFVIDTTDELADLLEFLYPTTVGQQHTGADLIAAERIRQIHDEGYSPGHDLAHGATALLSAASAYIDQSPTVWPFAPDLFKPSGDPIRDLTKAGALIAAALDVHLAQQST
ncbi:hypothetical protein [Mycolicibacterium mageritense]|uniref:hypothetical protein n=1 Tax=Mycolicibacterium mageritense TaxID=53462 RepID=UPI0011D32987|nr:hypothetical protein [Mycolicibacterium mageritense]TXI53504.1 MAG: hypothetical protein E6Q55_35050 [Mycolicibacterium mageritense]